MRRPPLLMLGTCAVEPRQGAGGVAVQATRSETCLVGADRPSARFRCFRRLALALALLASPTLPHWNARAQFSNHETALNAVLADPSTVDHNMFYVGPTWTYATQYATYGRAAVSQGSGDVFYWNFYGPGRVEVYWAIDSGSGSWAQVTLDGVVQSPIIYATTPNTTIAFNVPAGYHSVYLSWGRVYSKSPDWVYFQRLWVYHSPTWKTTPTSVYGTSGSYVSMSAEAYGGNMSYSWYDQNNNYLGSGTSVTFQMNTSTAGNIRCRASNSYGTSDNYATAYMVTTPVITAQPAPVVSAAGSSASFSVGVSSTSYQVSYQWLKNGSAISGQTSSYLYLSNLQASDAANYSCRIWNSAGTAYSSAASLTLATLPVITAQPESIIRPPGTSAAFSVTATGLALAYQWYKNSNVISGATSSSYSIANVVLGDAGYYQAKVSNPAGTVWSSNAYLTTVIPPAITVQPVSLVVTQSHAATFSVTATGSSPAYQWWKGSTGLVELIAQDFNATDGGFTVLNSISFDGPWTYNSSSGTWRTDGQATDTQHPNSSGLNTPTFPLTNSGSLRLSFAHRYNFEEGMDGGQVRISVNGGAYTTVPRTAFSQGAYNSEVLALITPSGLESELKGQLCYSGMSFSYWGDPGAPWLPPYDTAIADLGSFNEGDTISLQFLAAYNNVARATTPNWQIDSLNLRLTWNDLTLLPGATATNYTIASAQPVDAGRYSVVVSNAAGVVKSDLAKLTVLVPPLITTQPLSQYVPIGGTISLTAAATGTVPLSYQWQCNNSSLAGATNPALTLANATTANSGNYRLIVTNVGGRATSTVAVATVMATPKMLVAPTSVFTNLGGRAVLSATVSGGGPPAYQWYFREQPLTGATNATLTMDQTELAQAGWYFLRVTNRVGSIESPRVWILASPLENRAVGWGDGSSGQTLFTTEWTNLVSLSAGDTHTLGLRGDGTVLAAGGNDAGQCTVPALTLRAVGIAAGANHSLAVLENGTVTAWGNNDNGQTDVPAGLSNVVAVAAGAAHSAALQVDGTVVVWGGDDALIRTVPAEAVQVRSLTAAAKLTMAVRDDGSVVVWGTDLNDLDVLPVHGTNLLAAAASPQHAVAVRGDTAAVTWGDDSYAQADVPAGATSIVGVGAGRFHSLAMPSAGPPLAWGAGMTNNAEEWPHFGQSTVPDEVIAATAIAGGAYFSVAAVPALPRLLEDLPSRVGYRLGQTVTFEVKAAGGRPLRYQWSKNGEAVSGATNATLVLTNLGPYAGAAYSVTVSNLAGLVTSGNLSLELDTVYEPLQIVLQPQSANVLRTANYTLSVGAQGTAPLRYQWQRDGASIAGATNEYYRTPTAQLSDAASYAVVVDNIWETLTSDTARVDLFDPPAWPESYTNATLVAGQALTLTVDNTGSGPFDYTWYHDGQPLEGVHTNGYTVGALTWEDEGEYAVKISNPVGSITRTFYKLHVVSAPHFYLDLADVASPRGVDAPFAFAVGGEPPLTYLWYQNGLLMPDEFRTNMVVPNVTYTHTNFTWQVVVTNFMGSITSRVAQLTIIEPPTILTQPVSVIAEPNTEATFSVTCGGTLPLHYQWLLNGAPVGGGTNATLVIPSVTSARQGAYEVQVSNPAGTVTSTAATLGANVAPVALGASTVRTNVAPGSVFELAARVAGLGPFTFQWQLNGVDIPAQTNLTLVVTNTPPEAARWYGFTVSNAYGSDTLAMAAGAEVRVVDLPFIESGPDDVLAILGHAATFSVTVRGTNRVSYQWIKDGDSIAGATSSSYTIPSPTLPDVGQYGVAVANAEGTTWSSLASLTFAKLPRIVRHPLAATIPPGSTAEFSVEVESVCPSLTSGGWMARSCPTKPTPHCR